MVLDLHDICKSYLQGKEPVPVLHDITLQVDEGEYLAIMGPSGSGKSTLMNIIGLLDKQTSGSYFFDGQDMAQCSDNQLSGIRNQKIGFVFQNFNLLPRQSVLKTWRCLCSMPACGKRPAGAGKEMLTRVGLEDRVNFKPTQLSGGQKQRVAIARAMVSHPRLLLADEPTGALDTRSGEQIMELFAQLNAEGVTIVMITHELEIAQHAQRIVTIRDGRLEQGGFGERRTEQEGDAS
ncbi:MAG: ABC transporter ATP-binding protein [Ruminococcus sp.]